MPIFTHVQRATSATSPVSLTGVGAGNLVIVNLFSFNSTNPTASITGDGTLSVTTNSGIPTDDGTATHRHCWTFYKLSSTGGNTNYALTLTNDTLYELSAEEFSYTGGPIAFDKDAVFGTTSAATPIVLPSITPTATGELLYSLAFPNGSVSGVGGSWSTGGGAFGGVQNAYILSSSAGATTVNFTDTNNPDAWSSMVSAFGSGAAPVNNNIVSVVIAR